MAEFVYAKHKGVDGLAYLSKDAIDAGLFPGWTEASEKEVKAELEPKPAQPSARTTS